MKKNVVKAVLFLVIVVGLFLGSQRVFTVSNTLFEHAEMMMKGYYLTPENTTDAVLIGNSHIYRYWQGAFGFQQRGIAAIGLSTSDMPCSIFRNMGIEAKKTQNPKVIVFDALAFAKDETLLNNKIYYVTSNMKFSKNKLDTIKRFCDVNDMSLSDRLIYYFPSIQFHSRWQELQKRDFFQTKTSYLNSTYESGFLRKTIKPIKHNLTDSRKKIGEGQEETLRDLLEWCVQQEDCEIEFVAVPVLWKKKDMGMINYVGDIIEEYGIKFVNYNTEENYALFGFDESQHFQDRNHTNVKGSYMFCDVFGQHLVDEYGLADHRGEEAYRSWQEKTDKYLEIIKKHFSL